MKKIILLFLFLTNISLNLLSSESAKPVTVKIEDSQSNFFNDVCNNQDKYSLILLLTDKENNINIANLNLHKLKKCEFPTGPLRNNNVSCIDFTAISNEVMTKINSLVEEKKCFELPLFCIDSLPNVKTCGFELPIPNKSNFCYVFNLDKELKETKGFILSNILLDELLKLNEEEDDDIDIETEKAKDTIVAEEQPKESSCFNNLINKIKDEAISKLGKIGCFIFMKLIDIKEALKFKK